MGEGAGEQHDHPFTVAAWSRLEVEPSLADVGEGDPHPLLGVSGLRVPELDDAVEAHQGATSIGLENRPVSGFVEHRREVADEDGECDEMWKRLLHGSLRLPRCQHRFCLVYL